MTRIVAFSVGLRDPKSFVFLYVSLKMGPRREPKWARNCIRDYPGMNQESYQNRTRTVIRLALGNHFFLANPGKINWFNQMESGKSFPGLGLSISIKWFHSILSQCIFSGDSPAVRLIQSNFISSPIVWSPWFTITNIIHHHSITMFNGSFHIPTIRHNCFWIIITISIHDLSSFMMH